MMSSKWQKLGWFLNGQIVANTELQNKQDLWTCEQYVSPYFLYNPHYGFVAKRIGNKVGQVFPYATCNNYSFVLFVDWSIMKLVLQFGKVQL